MNVLPANLKLKFELKLVDLSLHYPTPYATI